jgi:hypothetical protein
MLALTLVLIARHRSSGLTLNPIIKCRLHMSCEIDNALGQPLGTKKHAKTLYSCGWRPRSSHVGKIADCES